MLTKIPGLRRNIIFSCLPTLALSSLDDHDHDAFSTPVNKIHPLACIINTKRLDRRPRCGRHSVWEGLGEPFLANHPVGFPKPTTLRENGGKTQDCRDRERIRRAPLQASVYVCLSQYSLFKQKQG